MFTDPPLAHVGLSEGEAQRQGVTARVTRLPVNAVLRTQTIAPSQGFVKALFCGMTTAFAFSASR
jgi:pyruvate/2-oxoglutarate dehydrogenase complex dihydrolipoamide dehydrogenase (E3) component